MTSVSTNCRNILSAAGCWTSRSVWTADSMDEIRPLAAEVGVLPRVHGSGLFTRGQTQVLTVATLGPVSDAQMLDGIDDEEIKRYMHHYNFPSYSVGETKSQPWPRPP